MSEKLLKEIFRMDSCYTEYQTLKDFIKNNEVWDIQVTQNANCYVEYVVVTYVENEDKQCV